MLNQSNKIFGDATSPSGDIAENRLFGGATSPSEDIAENRLFGGATSPSEDIAKKSSANTTLNSTPTYASSGAG